MGSCQTLFVGYLTLESQDPKPKIQDIKKRQGMSLKEDLVFYVEAWADAPLPGSGTSKSSGA